MWGGGGRGGGRLVGQPGPHPSVYPKHANLSRYFLRLDPFITAASGARVRIKGQEEPGFGCITKL